MVDGIQSLFQCLNIEVQDISPDVQNPRYNSTEDFSISTKTVTIRRRCGCDEQRTDKWFKT
ncbi:hypothetical protein B6J50_24050 [Klebsiella pneumoniae]|uniref:Uncharacterized protein n=1 Tax=Klebsiella pneumoniae TaxID=573 RepID=A0A483IIW5_KLEPN|nr:hypothetical protein B6J50_24050 [Klebsiella pneumoniae]